MAAWVVGWSALAVAFSRAVGGVASATGGAGLDLEPTVVAAPAAVAAFAFAALVGFPGVLWPRPVAG